MDDTTVNKLVDSGKKPSADKQDNVDNDSNVKAVKDLVKIEVTEKNGRVKNMEQKIAEKLTNSSKKIKM